MAITWGLHFYLKHYCNVHISWDGAQITLPKKLPKVQVKIISNDRWYNVWNFVMSDFTTVHIFTVFHFSDSDIIRTCALWVIVRPGGSGSNGREISTGWLLMGSILPSLLLRKRRFGKDCIKNWISQKKKSMSIWVVLHSYLGMVLPVREYIHLFLIF